MSGLVKPITQNYTKAYLQMKKNPLAEASASFIATVLLILVLFILLIRPTILTISKLQARIEELGQINISLETKKQSLERLITKYDTMGDDIALANQAMPNKTEFIEIEKQLRYLTQKHNLLISSVSFTEFPLLPKSSTFFSIQAVNQGDSLLPSVGMMGTTFTVYGEYDDIKNFIGEVEKLIRIVSIDTITFKSESQGNDNSINIHISTRLFYEKDGAKQ